jgi:hypothetical protein
LSSQRLVFLWKTTLSSPPKISASPAPGRAHAAPNARPSGHGVWPAKRLMYDV